MAEKIVTFIDFETTSLSPNQGYIIEAAAIQMSYQEDIGLINKVLKQYWSYNDPEIDIPKKITEITGINNSMVKGKIMNWNKLNALLDESDLIVAHNADFDKRWAIVHGDSRSDNWVCSVNLINWKNKHGFENAKLEQLKKSHNIKSESHKAIEDVRTLIKLLRLKDKEGNTYFKELLDNYNSGLIQHVVKIPFSEKEKIKKLNYRWNPAFKTWYRIMSKKQYNEIKHVLNNIQILQQKIQKN